MLTRTATAAAVAWGVVCPAHADTHIELHGTGPRLETQASSAAPVSPMVSGSSTIVIGTPSAEVTIGSVKLAVDAFTNGNRARMTLVLQSASTRSIDSETSIAVPHGARVTKLALTLGHGPRMSSAALPASTAVGTYERTVHGNADPALLTLERETEQHDRLALRVFPLSRAAAATVELELELPPAPALTVESTQRIDTLTVEVAGRSRGTSRFDEAFEIALPAARGEMAIGQGAVNASSSLFVDAPSTGPGARLVHRAVVISCGFGTAHHSVSLDKRTIRTEVRRHMSQLGYCYSKQLQRHQALAGSVALHFRIGPDGTTSNISVDGALDSDTVKQCMSEQVAQWRFHESDDIVQVNYPLDLRSSW